MGKRGSGSTKAALAVLVILAAFLVSCGLLVSFDDVDTGDPARWAASVDTRHNAPER